MADRIMNQLLLGVAYLHSCDVLHGDIKLENLLIVEGSREAPEKLRIKIIDFEHAQHLKENGSLKSSKYLGTSMYLAPESAKDLKYSHKSDIFAVGCVIFHLHAKKTYPLDRNRTPSITGIEHQIKKEKYNRTKTDQIYTKMIRVLVKREPQERPTAKEAIKMLETGSIT